MSSRAWSRRQCVGSTCRMWVVLICISCAGVGLGGCVTPDCDLEVQAKVRSPDNKRFATAYEQACGVLSRMNTRVAVYSTSQLLSEAELAFATDGRYDVGLTWKDKDTLEVGFDCQGGACDDGRIAQPHVLKRNVDGVSVQFVYSAKVQAAIEQASTVRAK